MPQPWAPAALPPSDCPRHPLQWPPVCIRGPSSGM